MSNTSSPLGLLADDAWLRPYAADVRDRHRRFVEALGDLEGRAGSLENFANAHRYLGLNYDAAQQGWYYREWAPAARALFLTGDFNDWDRQAVPLERVDYGVWEVFVPTERYPRLRHGCRLKVHVHTAEGGQDRLPAYIRRVVQDPDTHDFAGQLWHPPDPFVWTDQDFDPRQLGTPFIYEAHTGMATEALRVGTYREFAERVIPHVVAAGYNTIQLMAVMEHPYYGSFGYHVANFFAPSSRFGTPEDLKHLINTAHAQGLAVVMDVVHSHAVKNRAEGLNGFDGSDHQYFHPGPRGYHTGWDSLLFQYGKREVQQFLLSNLRYWLEEFHFDGFRFDGVTSMLYTHHGEGVGFGDYEGYFRVGVDQDAVTYLQLANELIGRIRPGALRIAEDMSGMPGTCRPIAEGGLGFDYRLAMGIPDYWIKLLKHQRDEDWDIHNIWYELNNRRLKEKNIAYAESHDQALVGDKTLAFRLMDKEMYFRMGKSEHSVVVDRGMALHKLIRLLTASLGGESYLNFMGNEFGHPEWIDFPREGNGWSYQHARRQWSLAHNPDLRYAQLLHFDRDLIGLLRDHRVLEDPRAHELNLDPTNQTLIYARGPLVFVCCLHPTRSVEDYRFFVPTAGRYRVLLSSDDPAYGGFDRVDTTVSYETFVEDEVPRLSLYVTNRTALVLHRAED